ARIPGAVLMERRTDRRSGPLPVSEGTMSRLATLCVMLLLSAAPAAAQSRVGTAAATFLTLGTGARGSSVGHAYTAAATGADGLFWNPSGIARSAEGSGPRGSLLFSHYQWFEEVDYNALGAV